MRSDSRKMTSFVKSSEPSLRYLLLKLWSHLSRVRRRQLGLLIILMLCCSALEVVSLAAVLPFLAVLTNPDSIWSNPSLRNWAINFGIVRANDLLFPITLAFSFVAIFAGIVRLVNLWANGRLAAAIGSELSCKAFYHTLCQPYESHVKYNSNDLKASIFTDTYRVINLVINPLLVAASSSISVVALLVLIVNINFTASASLILSLCFSYLTAVFISKKYNQNLGNQEVNLARRLMRMIDESFAGIRDIILDNLQNRAYKRYAQIDIYLRLSQSKSLFLKTYPRAIIEPIGIAILSLCAFVLVSSQGFIDALPLFGVLVFGLQKMLPFGQKIYDGWIASHNAKKSLINILSLIDQPLPLWCRKKINVIPLNAEVCFENVSYSYSSSTPLILNNVNLTISNGERIGVVGVTGGGKSTLIDLLMGLLTPTSGLIKIDGSDLHESENVQLLLSWRKLISHVPQDIFLLDATIAENIALGCDVNEIDWNLMRRVAFNAQLMDFINSSKFGFSTTIGERGVQLSGGQRQRIGIARALYNQPKLLILDEATSALDYQTETLIMQNIYTLTEDITLIMIAHRIESLKFCDRVYTVENRNIHLLP